MKCSAGLPVILRTAVLLSCAALSLTCDESLPTYVFPQHVLSLEVAMAKQLNNHDGPPSRQGVHFRLVGENIFDEVFLDSVDIKGSVRIWWKRKPFRFKTIYLSARDLADPGLVVNKKMMLLPGQKFSMDLYWNCKSDDSLYLPYDMNYDYSERRLCDYNVLCSDLEDFVVEASLNVYDRLGYVAAPPMDFKFFGTMCYNCGIGPYCPAPPGGCGQ